MVICDKVRSGQKTQTPKHIFTALPESCSDLAKGLKNYSFALIKLKTTSPLHMFRSSLNSI